MKEKKVEGKPRDRPAMHIGAKFLMKTYLKFCPPTNSAEQDEIVFFFNTTMKL